LLIDDYMLGRTVQSTKDIKQLRDFADLLNFFETHGNRKIVYLTFGTQALATEMVFTCIRFLLDSDIAVVTSIDVRELTEEQRKRYYFAHYLPMHLISERADLIVHQCGSGTYHYPILHNVPTITLGTKCFDREDVALRLEELGVSTHIPAPDECENFVESFKRAIAEYFAESGRLMQKRKARLLSLKAEIDETSARFDFEGLLRRAVNATPRSRSRGA
jgi:UDP:flavonoid glycosyltransferase YjiC (YdhE family)